MATSSALGLGDLALTWDESTMDGDLSMIDADLSSDRGLLTAVQLSLFTDRRAETDDVPPSGDPNDRRGWWADEFLPDEGDRIGSRLWLLDRSKITNDTQRRADEYAREALVWLIADRVVARIDVEVAVSASVMAFEVIIARPGREAIRFRFSRVWDALTQ